MHPISITAASAAEAVAQVRTRLGPEAVVLNVRPLPANGIARLWQKPMIEVLAYKPEALGLNAAPVSQALAGFIQQLKDAKRTESPKSSIETNTMVLEPEIPASTLVEAGDINDGNWRAGAMLRKTGFLPLHAQFVLDQLRLKHGENPPASLGREIELVREVLAKSWRKPKALAANSTHVLVGPAGSGKTTCLCKWLTQTALVEGRLARVWRLDGATANMAESLSVYCEILGLPSERLWQTDTGAMVEDIGFIDLPGVDWRKPMAVKELGGQLKRLGSPRVHLVLNGAYDISVLLAQVRSFASLPIEDLIITHLDEKPSWGKLWNLVLGTNYSIRYFSTGQNIPGDFCEATAEMMFDRQFPRK